MPLTRGRRAKEHAVRAAGAHEKRAPSPSEEAPRKRGAFLNLTNAGKGLVRFPGSKKKANAPPKSGTEQKAPTVAREEEENAADREEKAPAVDREEKENAVGQVPEAPRPPAHLERPQIPPEFDVDAEDRDDCLTCPEYAKDIFDYLKSREEKFALPDFMALQPAVNAEMRAILVDWLVEVQENFELYHETLYLAVKLTDHFLARTPVARQSLQLLGSAALMIACKFEERNPPCVEDFVYICDDTYSKEQFLSMESRIFSALGFDIGIPIAYSFLRRYAKCAGVGMDTLTLARYYCELSLMDAELARERASLLAAACLLLALLGKDLQGWSPVLRFHSGYALPEVGPVARRLHSTLAQPPSGNLNAVRQKYAHPVFFRVALLPLVAVDVLEKLSSA